MDDKSASFTEFVNSRPLDAIDATPPTKLVKGRRLRSFDPKFTPIVENAMRMGHTDGMVADLLGGNRATLSRWLEQGLDPDCPHDELVEFAQRAKAGRAAVLADLTEQLKVHATTNAAACIKMMEILSPDHNPARRVEQTQVAKLPLLENLKALPAEDFAALERAAAILRRGGE